MALEKNEINQKRGNIMDAKINKFYENCYFAYGEMGNIKRIGASYSDFKRMVEFAIRADGGKVTALNNLIVYEHRIDSSMHYSYEADLIDFWNSKQ